MHCWRRRSSEKIPRLSSFSKLLHISQIQTMVAGFLASAYSFSVRLISRETDAKCCQERYQSLRKRYCVCSLNSCVSIIYLQLAKQSMFRFFLCHSRLLMVLRWRAFVTLELSWRLFQKWFGRWCLAISCREVDGILVTNGCGNVTDDDLLSFVIYIYFLMWKGRL